MFNKCMLLITVLPLLWSCENYEPRVCDIVFVSVERQRRATDDSVPDFQLEWRGLFHSDHKVATPGCDDSEKDHYAVHLTSRDELWQGCDKLWHGCDRLWRAVTSYDKVMTSCDMDMTSCVGLWQGYQRDKAVTICDEAETSYDKADEMWQDCDELWQWCDDDEDCSIPVTRLLELRRRVRNFTDTCSQSRLSPLLVHCG